MLNYLSRQFELSRGDGHNMRAMEGMRGFAVFLVFLVHYATLIAPWLPRGSAVAAVADAVHTVGNAGVDLFFVLSGYLIYGSLIKREQSFMPYMWRRIVRIYPAFLAVFALYLALSLAMPSESKIPAGWGPALLYCLQNLLLLPGVFPITPIITVAWSLSYEVFFYICVPIGIAVLNLRQRSGAWRTGLFVALALLLLVWCALAGGHVRMVMFLGGMVLWEGLARVSSKAPGGASAGIALVLALAVALLPLRGEAGYAVKVALQCVCFVWMCYACFCNQQAGLTRAFKWTPMRWLGNMSYSYYLLHGLGLKACFMLLHAVYPVTANPTALLLAFLPFAFAVTLVPSALLFLLIERPLSLSRATPAQPAVPAQAGGAERDAPSYHQL